LLRLRYLSVLTTSLFHTHLTRLQGKEEELRDFIIDSRRLVLMSEEPISQSVPHIYLSVVAKQFCSKFPNNVSITEGQLMVWEACLQLKGHEDAITSVSFSPNGNRIVSGSLDKTIRVWDAWEGKPPMEPLAGDTALVWSLPSHTMATVTYRALSTTQSEYGMRRPANRAWIPLKATPNMFALLRSRPMVIASCQALLTGRSEYGVHKLANHL
jgi:hypothetical protein